MATAETAALVFRHRPQGNVQTMHLPQALGARLQGYVSSIAVARDGHTAAVTSSKGGIAVLMEIATGRVLGAIDVPDVSGVATAAIGAGAFQLTTGAGAQLRVSASSVVRRPSPWQWDNHQQVEVGLG